MRPGGMRPGLPMQPQIIFADQLFWSDLHLTIGNSALSAAAFCAALSQVGDRPVDHRSCLPAYQQWQHVVRPLEDPDWLAAHLQNIAAQPGTRQCIVCPSAAWQSPNYDV